MRKNIVVLLKVGKHVEATEILDVALKNYPENTRVRRLKNQLSNGATKTTNKKAFFATDVGQHQMWSAQLINCQPRKWVSSSGLGTMGFGLPAAIGAQVANPDQDVFCISGDSSIQMSIQELGTLAQYDLGIKIIIANNGWQGMVRQWQESFYGNRF